MLASTKVAKRKEKLLIADSIENLKVRVPNMFIKTHAERLSEKYTHIDGYDIFQYLNTLGWEISTRPNATQTRNSKKDGHHGTYMVRMFNSKFMNKERATELLMFGSHNGRCSIKFRIGTIEFACANGLVTMSKESQKLAKMKVVHKGDIKERLQIVLDTIKEETEKINTIVHKMKKLTLSGVQMEEFALKAIQLKGLDIQAKKTNAKLYDEKMAIQSALQSPQNYDKKVVGQNGKSVWHVFNRIQNAFVSGEVRYGLKEKTVKLRHAIKIEADYKKQNALRKELDIIQNSNKVKNDEYNGFFQKSTAITGIDSVYDVNQGLWELALELI
jgi:hypothetical protein